MTIKSLDQNCMGGGAFIGLIPKAKLGHCLLHVMNMS